jgi:hypothetical protein
VWTSAASLRTVLGLSATDLDDPTANDIIQKAQEAVKRDLAEYILDKELEGAIDGANKEFKTDLVPIGDGNFDLLTNKNDVTVHGWTDEEDESTKVELTVDKISPNTGLITLVSAPPSTYKKVTGTYWKFWAPMNEKLIEQSTNYFAAYLYLINQYMFAPLEFVLGSMRSRYTSPRGGGMGALFPYTRVWIEYSKLITMLKSKHVTVSEAEGTEVSEPVEIEGT